MKVFLISLPDSRQRRLVRTQEPFESQDLPFETVDGVEAKKMRARMPAGGVPQISRCCRAKSDAMPRICARLQRIVDYDLPWGYVLEDDFCYVSNPDYGLVEIADVLPESFDYIALFRSLGINDRYRRHEESGAFCRLCETEYLATGYIAHRTFAEHVLRHHPLCEMPIDHLYAKLSHNRDCFESISPVIAIASGFGSDIHGD
jgi:GR25 family glycosyltransferase involved in LPS biosynthesis